jgi:single-strand DNA-binding protein
MATRTSKPAAKTPPAKPAATYGEREDGMVSGNMTGDPELHFTPSGRAVSNFSIAVNEREKNEETGEWEDTDPQFHRVTVWGEQAQRVAECFRRGDRVVAVGYFQDRTWTDKEGEERVTEEFTAKEIGPSLLFRDAEIKRPTRTSGKR